MSHRSGNISFHVLEDRESGVTDVFMAPEHTPYATEDDLLRGEKVFSIVNQTYVQTQRSDVQKEELCYFICKEQNDISDYCEILQAFVAQVCDFQDRMYTIYLKVSTF